MALKPTDTSAGDDSVKPSDAAKTPVAADTSTAAAPKTAPKPPAKPASKAVEPAPTPEDPYPSQADLDEMRAGTHKGRRQLTPSAGPGEYETR